MSNRSDGGANIFMVHSNINDGSKPSPPPAPAPAPVERKRQHWIWSWWGWLTKPVVAWPNPPRNDDNNCRGIGWGGDRGQVRPFEPPKGHGP